MLKDIISEIMSVIIYISTLANFSNFIQLYIIYILYNWLCSQNNNIIIDRNEHQ